MRIGQAGYEDEVDDAGEVAPTIEDFERYWSRTLARVGSPDRDDATRWQATARRGEHL